MLRANNRHRSVHIDGTLKRILDISYYRLLFSLAMFGFCFGAVGLRLVDLALADSEQIVSKARVYKKSPEIKRADIVDRNGMLLATNLSATSVYADPKHVVDAKETVEKLSTVFPEINARRLQAALMSKRRFVWIKRGLTPIQERQVLQLGLPGVEFKAEQRRFYPQGSIAAHVVGSVDVDGQGINGAEHWFNAELEHEKFEKATEPLALTIDSRVQHVTHAALSKAVEEFQAIGGAAIVMDAKTSEVVSMVSLPDFDPNNLNTLQGDAGFNRATLGVYELGSVFKAFTVASAVEEGMTTMEKQYDATTPIRIGRFTIRDYHPEERMLNTAELFMHSSNIATARMADEVGKDKQYEFLAKLGLLRTLETQLAEVGTPIYPDNWGRINMMTISYGHGIAVTPMHLVNAIATLVNGGTYRTPTIKTDKKLQEGKRVLKEKTSDFMRKLFRVVVADGTAKKANVEGYVVGGKTGTAEKPKSGSYDRKAKISSFVGAFPMHDPKYVVYVVLDEPQPTKETWGYATGGWVAAPIVKDIIEGMTAVLGIQPYDESKPEIERALTIASIGQ